MQKILIICAMAACLAGCTEHCREDRAREYEYVSVASYGCNTCAQPTCPTCLPPIQPVLYQQPKTIVVMMPPAPQPAPIIEEEIIYQPQPSCGCKKCGCQKGAQSK